MTYSIVIEKNKIFRAYDKCRNKFKFRAISVMEKCTLNCFKKGDPRNIMNNNNALCLSIKNVG